MSEPLYSVGTWDTYRQRYSRQRGLSVPSINVPLWTLHKALKELRKCGYAAHRVRDADGCYDDNDWSVLVERTDGMPYREILKKWQR